MTQPASFSSSRPPRTPERRARPGFMLLLAGFVGAAGLAVWWFRPHAPPAEPSSPPPGETAAAPVPRPAVSYAQPRHRDFTKRRGAPLRAAPIAPAVTNAPAVPSIEELYGIRVCAMRMSFGNRFVDLRYQVMDSAKAARLGNGKTAAYLVDRATGRKLLMPQPPGEGAFPPTGNHLMDGRTYFALVANPQNRVQSGSELMFQVGGASPTNLVVQ
jgi:hypothetical protein